MTEVVAHTWYMLDRHVRDLLRQPVWIATLLSTPLVWLLLYSQLFRRITELPGFGTDSYIEFLMPGVVIMTAFFTGTWNGMSMINDLDRGIIERFLATPARRSSLVLGHVAQSSTIAILEALIVLSLGYALGARVAAGVAGWLVVLVAAALVTACFAGLSNGLALLTRRDATMIAVANFIALPLMFLSAILIAPELMPAWMRWAARFNPVNWGVAAAREAVQAGTKWPFVALQLGLLLAFAALTAAFATWAFRMYRRTL
ncbi:MAG: ABC transporter permease [Actinomycetota bacterium]|nr:ABC transporter permease [Actinomycetota bacterium]